MNNKEHDNLAQTVGVEPTFTTPFTVTYLEDRSGYVCIYYTTSGSRQVYSLPRRLSLS